MNRVMMASNLIRSVHMFSDAPVIVFVFGATHISIDWDPDAFPNLIVVHGGDLKEMTRGEKISFNFNKFRSMMFRIRTGVQLDADMIVAKHVDNLFVATAREITADYPFPILPVHWMTRYKDPNNPHGYSAYATQYPGDPDGTAEWPVRLRWCHAHPTWTHHALPFWTDTLIHKMDYAKWKNLARVVERFGPDAKQNPRQYLGEDEDMMNIMLWRYKQHKQWCKWDLEPGIYTGKHSLPKSDAKRRTARELCTVQGQG